MHVSTHWTRFRGLWISIDTTGKHSDSFVLCLAIHVQHVYTFGLQGKFLYVSVDHNKVLSNFILYLFHIILIILLKPINFSLLYSSNLRVTFVWPCRKCLKCFLAICGFKDQKQFSVREVPYLEQRYFDIVQSYCLTPKQSRDWFLESSHMALHCL